MPDIAAVAGLIGDPTRARLLAALLGGRALTATELAGVAGVTKQTVSAHLARLLSGRLVTVQSQGRHRYFRLSDRHVARLLEQLMSLAARAGPGSPRTGPADPALRSARVCYDHLAGESAVRLFGELQRRRYFRHGEKGMELSRNGVAFFREFGIDVDALRAQRRSLCRTCLDWSERREHLAGALGAALLLQLFDLGWARRLRSSRAVVFTALGRMEMRRQFDAFE